MKPGIIETVINVLRFACISALISPAFAVEVKDFGIEVPGVESIRWIDNDRLALVGLVHVPDRAITHYAGQRIGKLVILDTRTGKAEWHEEFFGRFCYDGQNFAVSSVDDIYHPSNNSHEYHFWIMRGSPGKLVRKEVTRDYLNSFDFTMACKGEDERQLPPWLESAKKSGRVFRALKQEHGWLEMAYADAFDSHHQRTYPLAIHPPGSENKPYPIDQSQFRPWFEKAYSLHLLRYEPFKNAYLLAAPNGMDGHKEGMLWWMYPDGRLEEFLKFKQQGEWGGVSYRNLIPTARDMLIVATKTPPQQNWGLYRVTAANRLELVVKGWAEGGGKAVSPDGCKVAFGIDPRGYPNTRYQLQIVDVCERNSK